MDMPHLAIAIDRLRETQLAHGITLSMIATQQGQIIAMMQDMERRQQERRQEGRAHKAFRGMDGLMKQVRPLVYIAALWAASILTMAYLAKGGDLMSAAGFLFGK